MNNKRQKHLLFFSEYFYPNQTSTAYYLTKIALTAARSYDGVVHLFCATPKDDHREINTPDHLTVHRIDNGNGDKNKIISRITKFCRISLKFIWAVIRNARHGDTVFSVTNPAFFIPICAFIKCFLKYRFVLLAFDVFPENLLAAGLLRKENILYKISKHVFDWGYRKADIVISIGRDMTEVLKQKGVSGKRIILIPNWADDNSIHYCSKRNNPIIQQYNLAPKTVFMFAGNFGRVQGIPELLDVIDHVSAENAAFLFVGNGAMNKAIEDYQKTHPQKAVFCHPYLPMDQQNIFLNACDVAIVTLNDKMFGLGVPSKSYYSLASGHPILFFGESRSEVAQMLQEGKCGWQCSFDNIDECVRLIEKICILPLNELESMGIRARNYLKENHSESIALEKYAKLFSA